MQKKVIALAVAGLVSGAAFAQSNVTIYGIVDVGVVHTTATGKDGGWRVDNGLLSGSRLGFKGEEGLGNGLKTVYTLEYMLQPDDNTALGATSLWTGSSTRQAYAGLSSATMGTVVAGRLQGVGFNFTCAYNPSAGNAFDTIGKLGAASLLSCGSGGRTNNSIGYMSPKWGGFSFEYNHARTTEEAQVGNVNSAVKDNYANLLGATYANGPLKIGAAYAHQNRDASNSVATNNDITEWGLGAEYDFKVVKVHASYQDMNTQNVTAGDGSKWQLGATIPVFSAGKVLLSYGRSNMDVDNTNASSYMLAYTHDLSKRTTLYAGYNHVSNQSAANRGIVTGTSATTGIATPALDGSASLIAAGIRHSF